jgi:hypothetical protein
MGCCVAGIFAICCIGAGIYIALGIWFTGLRARWGRKGEGTPLGPVSCAGMAMWFISLGLAALSGAVAGALSYSVPRLYSRLEILCAATGFALVIADDAFDMGFSPHSPDHPKSRLWALAPWAVGIVFIVALAVILCIPDDP